MWSEYLEVEAWKAVSGLYRVISDWMEGYGRRLVLVSIEYELLDGPACNIVDT